MDVCGVDGREHAGNRWEISRASDLPAAPNRDALPRPKPVQFRPHVHSALRGVRAVLGGGLSGVPRTRAAVTFLRPKAWSLRVWRENPRPQGAMNIP